MAITIDAYERAERDAWEKLSNRFIRAFRPTTFIARGFPIQVYSEQELVRYIDSQHAECIDRYFYRNLTGGLTELEFLRAMQLIKTLYWYTSRTYGEKFLTINPVLASICCLRGIEAAVGTDRNIKIFEIGAGSGILGCLLVRCGFRYVATDVTQAFYLLQNRLLSLFDENMCELAYDTQQYYADHQTAHVPYWALWDMKNQIDDIDIFVCNHALLEIDESALRFYLRFGQDAMKNSNYGLLLFQGTGWSTSMDFSSLIELFALYGYSLCYFDGQSQIGIFTLRDVSSISDALLKKSDHSDNALLYTEYAQEIVSNYRSLIGRISVGKETFLNACYEFCPSFSSPDEIFGEYLKQGRANARQCSDGLVQP